MRVGILFSGGKDSTYAAYLASQSDLPVCLITLFPSRDDSYMFHFPNLKWTELQAEAMGLQQVKVTTEGVKEAELEDLRRAVTMAKRVFGIEGIYTGALASDYQRSRVERICDEAGLKCSSPLWHVDPAAYLRKLLREKFSVVVTSVSALGLDETWLGRVINEDAIQELVKLNAKYGVHIGLEGGEGETFVTDCPLFSRRIEIQDARKEWKGDSGQLTITKAALVPK